MILPSHVIYRKQRYVQLNALLFFIKILHLAFTASTLCSKPLFAANHWTHKTSLRKFLGAFGARSPLYSPVDESWLSKRTGLWPANWKSKQSQPDVHHESITSVVRKEAVGRRGLGRTQPVPRSHHFLWVSHRVLPLLHSLWDRAVQSQLNLPRTGKEGSIQSVANSLKTLWFWNFVHHISGERIDQLNTERFMTKNKGCGVL